MYMYISIIALLLKQERSSCFNDKNNTRISDQMNARHWFFKFAMHALLSMLLDQ